MPPSAQDRVAGACLHRAPGHHRLGYRTGRSAEPSASPGGCQRRSDPELLDAGGYLDCIEWCWWKFPELRILTGVELGQPHIDGDGARKLVDLSALDRVNGSLHTLPVPEAPEALRCEPITLYRRWPAERVVRDYLAEVHRVISGSDAFAVFTHIEYAVRDWPTQTEGPFDPRTFEDEFRQAMRAVAGSGRALELNVGGPIRPWIAQWWSEEGGRAITLASDAHTRRVWPATSSRRWQWPSTSASGRGAAPRTCGLAHNVRTYYHHFGLPPLTAFQPKVVLALIGIEMLNGVAQRGTGHRCREVIQVLPQAVWVLLACLADPATNRLLHQIVWVVRQDLANRGLS